MRKLLATVAAASALAVLPASAAFGQDNPADTNDVPAVDNPVDPNDDNSGFDDWGLLGLAGLLGLFGLAGRNRRTAATTTYDRDRTVTR
jgi:hypothetical protein